MGAGSFSIRPSCQLEVSSAPIAPLPHGLGAATIIDRTRPNTLCSLRRHNNHPWHPEAVSNHAEAREEGLCQRHLHLPAVAQEATRSASASLGT
jgi:hypothetical protein